MYVADIGRQLTYNYQIGTNGNLSNQKLFVDMGSDGMTLDEQGNVYLTGDGVSVFDSTGVSLEDIAVAILVYNLHLENELK